MEYFPSSQAVMASDDSIGPGIKPFYIGEKAAHSTADFIELAVKRFSNGTEPK
jgi:hypothetical protein